MSTPRSKSSLRWMAAGVVALVALLIVTLFLVFRAPDTPEPTTDAKLSTQDFLVSGSVKTIAPTEATKGIKGGASAPASNAYGWKWDRPVKVYDGTGNPRWRVADAAAAWSKSGLVLVMVASEAEADIVVTQGDANAMCGVTDPIIGCGDTTVGADGKPISGKIIMSEGWADWGYPDTLYGGTIHEFGHTVGFGHAPSPMTNKDSVMGVPIPANCAGGCARTRLSQYDNSGLRNLY